MFERPKRPAWEGKDCYCSQGVGAGDKQEGGERMRCKASDCFSCPYPDCINDSIQETRKYTQEQKKRAYQRMSERRKQRHDNGICTQCGKRPPKPGAKMCALCQAKWAKYKEEESRRKGIKPKEMLDGVLLCKKCGNAAPVSPYKVCQRCLDSNRKHIAKTPTNMGKKPRGAFSISHEMFWASKKQKSCS